MTIETIPARSWNRSFVSGSAPKKVTGVGLVEIYNLDAGSDSRLAHISGRGDVQTGNNVMIDGIIIGTGTTTVLIQELGPSLATSGVASFLADSLLGLFDLNEVLLIENDNW